jgi:hypothetical protein
LVLLVLAAGWQADDFVRPNEEDRLTIGAPSSFAAVAPPSVASRKTLSCYSLREPRSSGLFSSTPVGLAWCPSQTLDHD